MEYGDRFRASSTPAAPKAPGLFNTSQELSFRESDDQGGKVYVHNPQQQFSLDQQRKNLPIFPYRKHILWLLESHQVLVIVGQTGSGKSTQIPQFLMEAGWSNGGRIICCTQPRRLAAQELAQRVAEEKHSQVGDAIGYSVRFDDCTSPERTRVKYLTDGMLMRETMVDPLLSRYSVIMIDEAHERSLYTDIILGLLKKILKKRPELRIIISSATLQAEQYYKYFNDITKEKETCAMLSIPGRSHPIDIYYLNQPSPDYLRASADAIMEIHHKGEEGDILCFLTGRYEIEKVHTMIENLIELEKHKVSRKGMQMMILPLFSGLSVANQRKVFEVAPRRTRKVILSTNVAETSVTIPGIVYVVDCGFEKIKIYDAATQMDSLTVVGCSQSSAKQRAGRAGRERAGIVYRLYTQKDFDCLAPQAVPEIQRCNLAEVVMQLKALGIGDVLHFQFLSNPPKENLTNALDLLYSLKVLDESWHLTEFGNTLVEFPLIPSLARVLVAAGELGCGEQILTIVSMLTVPSVWITPREFRATADKMRMTFAVEEGDMLTLLNVFNRFKLAKNKIEWCKRHYVNHKILYKAEDVRNQLSRYARRFQVPIESSFNPVQIQKALVSGLFANVAQIQPDGSYKTVRGDHILHLHPSSVLFKYPPPWVLYYEVIRTSKEYMRDVTTIEPEWLGELASHYYDYKKRKKVVTL